MYVTVCASGECESVSVCEGRGTEHRVEKAPGCIEGMGLPGGMLSEDAVTCDCDEAACGTGPQAHCPGKPRALWEAWGTKAPSADELTKMASWARGIGGLGQGYVKRTLSGPPLPLEVSPGACMLVCVCVCVCISVPAFGSVCTCLFALMYPCLHTHVCAPPARGGLTPAYIAEPHREGPFPAQEAF